MSSHALALLQAAFGAQTLVGNGDGSGTPPSKRSKAGEASGNAPQTMEDIFNSVGVRGVVGVESGQRIELFVEENAIQQEGLIAEKERLRSFLSNDVDEFDLYFEHFIFTDAQMDFIFTKIEQSQTIERIHFNFLDDAMVNFINTSVEEQMPWKTRIRKALRENRSIRHLILYNKNILYPQHSLNPTRVLQNYFVFLNMFKGNLPQSLTHIEFEDFIHTYQYLQIRDFIDTPPEDRTEELQEVITELSEWMDLFLREWNDFISSLQRMRVIKIVEDPGLLRTTDGLLEYFQNLLHPFKSIRVLEILDLSEINIFKFIIKKDWIRWVEGGLVTKPDGMICKGRSGEMYELINELSTTNKTLGFIMVPFVKIWADGRIQEGSFNWRRWQLRPMEWTFQNLEIPWVKKQRGFGQKVDLIKRKLHQLTGLSEPMTDEIIKYFSEESIDLNIDGQFTPLRELLGAKGVTDDELSERLGHFLPRKESGDIAFYMSDFPIQGIIEPESEEEPE